MGRPFKLTDHQKSEAIKREVDGVQRQRIETPALG
jgi:hypothetical protein